MCAVVFLNQCTGARACLTPVHYCVVADSSNSISNQLWARLTRDIRLIATGFSLGPGVADSKIALVKYGREVVREFNFSSTLNEAEVLDAISSAQRLPMRRVGGTATPDAILECLQIFKEQGQANVSQVIMVFTDGVTFYRGQTAEESKQRLLNAVHMSTEARTVNFGVVFTGNNPEQAQNESLTIAQGAQERAFYGRALRVLEQQLFERLSCGRCMQ